MTVFSLFSNAHRATEIDLFLASPIDFGAAWGRRVQKEVVAGVEAIFPSLNDLIALKELTGRTRDHEDVKALRSLHRSSDE
jgi:hypothetical protein